MKHHCKERERLEELKSPRGQAAYALYAEWMRLQKRSIPVPETFMSSKQYNYFVKFVDWSDKTSIPNPTQFVKIMVDTATQPVLWCRDTTYSLYLQWYDGAYPPEQQFIDTLDRLHVFAEDLAVPLNAVYDTLGPYALAKLVRRRKLSPWLLVVSPVFLKWVVSRPQHERDMLNEAINFSAYATKLNQQVVMAREFRAACEAENL